MLATKKSVKHKIGLHFIMAHFPILLLDFSAKCKFANRCFDHSGHIFLIISRFNKILRTFSKQSESMTNDGSHCQIKPLSILTMINEIIYFSRWNSSPLECLQNAQKKSLTRHPLIEKNKSFSHHNGDGKLNIFCKFYLM